MIDQTFAPAYGSAILIASVTTTSAATAVGLGSKSLVVTNTGAANIYLRTGLSTVTTTSADYILLPLSQVSISKPQDHTHIAYATDALTSSLHVIPGEGF
jgi:hypothetical protein